MNILKFAVTSTAFFPQIFGRRRNWVSGVRSKCKFWVCQISTIYGLDFSHPWPLGPSSIERGWSSCLISRNNHWLDSRAQHSAWHTEAAQSTEQCQSADMAWPGSLGWPYQGMELFGYLKQSWNHQISNFLNLQGSLYGSWSSLRSEATEEYMWTLRERCCHTAQLWVILPPTGDGEHCSQHFLFQPARGKERRNISGVVCAKF